MFVGKTIRLAADGPAGGSIEGLIYTPVSILFQMRGWLEVVTQALLLSALLCYWVNHPKRMAELVSGDHLLHRDGSSGAGPADPQI